MNMKLSLTLICMIVIVIGGTTRSSSTCNPVQVDQAEQSNHSQVVLNLLVTAPYPPSDRGWDGGIAVIAAVRLALRQINNHSEILPGYTLRAVEDDSGCQVKPTATISLLRNVFYSQQNIVGMIGPGCSASAIHLAPVLSRPEVSLIQIAPAATSPDIERLNQNTTFTIRAPLQMINNAVELLKRSNWKKFAILYDPSRTIFRTFHDVILQETKKNNISTSFDSIVIDNKIDQDNADKFFPLEELKRSRSRIIILLVESRRTIHRIMCIAYNMRMIYPLYQWIFLERSLDELLFGKLEPFEAHGINYNCSKEQMVTALNGSIISEYALNRTDNTSITPLCTSYKEYRELFGEELSRHFNESKVQQLIKASNRSQKYFERNDYWENPYYDAAWVFGLALHEVAKKMNLSNYRYGQKNITKAILDEFFNVTFQGASSLIQFTPARNVLSSIITSSLTRNGSELTSRYLCSHNGSGRVSCLDRYSPINDSYEEVFERMHVSAGVIIIFVAMAIWIFTISLHILFVKYREKKSVKATSPTLSHLIFSGCYLYCIATVISILLQVLPLQKSPLLYSVFCNIVMWCVITGASLIFGTVLVKIWRIFRLFRHFSNERPGVLLSNQVLTFGVLFLVAVDAIFCACWSSFDPYIMAERPFQVVGSGIEVDAVKIKMIVQCKCNNIYIWIGVVLGLKVPIIIILMILAFLNRQIKRKHFSHTKKVNILVYSLTIICGAGFPLFFILLELSDSVYVSLIFCFILLASVIVCCVLLFIPPLRHLDDRHVRSTLSRFIFSVHNINSHHHS